MLLCHNSENVSSLTLCSQCRKILERNRKFSFSSKLYREKPLSADVRLGQNHSDSFDDIH